MKLVNYLEAIMVGNYVIKKFIEPTLKTKKHFWIPLREKYTRDLQPKRMTALHQLGINHLNMLLSIQGKRISISTFTNTNDIKKLATEQSIGGGRGLLAIVEGTPLLRSHKDIKSSTERNIKGIKENIGRGDRWINLGDFGGKNIISIKNEALQKIQNYLGNKDLNLLTQKESNKFISFYYNTIWNVLKQKNPNNDKYYTYLSDGSLKDFLISNGLAFTGNKSNSMKYNEVIMNKIKIIKIYYNPELEDELNKYKIESNFPFIEFNENELNEILLDIRSQILGKEKL